MRKLSLVCLNIIFITAPRLALAQPASDTTSVAKAEAFIETIAKDDQFSGAVLVAKNGIPLFRQSFGLANTEWNVPNTPDTKFRIGSNTKQFTATAILQLAEAGKLSIDDPVSKYYPDAPPAWKDITIKHLLTHTSGIPSYTAIPHFFSGDSRLDRTPDEIIKLTRISLWNLSPAPSFHTTTAAISFSGTLSKKSRVSIMPTMCSTIFLIHSA
jgi:D-alanyl-D-alanine carboxypeptidase